MAIFCTVDDAMMPPAQGPRPALPPWSEAFRPHRREPPHRCHPPRCRPPHAFCQHGHRRALCTFFDRHRGQGNSKDASNELLEPTVGVLVSGFNFDTLGNDVLVAVHPNLLECLGKFRKVGIINLVDVNFRDQTSFFANPSTFLACNMSSTITSNFILTDASTSSIAFPSSLSCSSFCFSPRTPRRVPVCGRQ